MKVKYLTIKKNGYVIEGSPEFGYCITLEGDVVCKGFSKRWIFLTIQEARAYVDYLTEEE